MKAIALVLCFLAVAFAVPAKVAPRIEKPKDAVGYIKVVTVPKGDQRARSSIPAPKAPVKPNPNPPATAANHDPSLIFTPNIIGQTPATPAAPAKCGVCGSDKPCNCALKAGKPCPVCGSSAPCSCNLSHLKMPEQKQPAHTARDADTSLIFKPPIITKPAPVVPKREPNNGLLSFAELVACTPHSVATTVQALLPHVNNALSEFDILECHRKAAFLSFVGQATASFRSFQGRGDGSKHENRQDLGNTNKGDGPKYKSRGALQLLGKNAFTAAGAALKVDLVNKPELASTPELAFRIAGWQWTQIKGNDLADRKTTAAFDTITYRLKGTPSNHARVRHIRYEQCLKALACPAK